MWPRYAEMILGVWLIQSPLLINDTGSTAYTTISSVVGGGALFLLALLAFLPRLKRIHFLSLGVAGVLAGIGYVADPMSLDSQNLVVIALTVMLFAILPNKINQPPEAWRDNPA